MKNLLWVGAVLLLLGMASLFIPIPRMEQEGVKVSGISLNVGARHEQKIPPMASGLMIVAGAGLMIAAKSRRAVKS